MLLKMANLWHDRLYAVRGLLRVLAEIQGELDRWLPFPRHAARLEPLVVRLGKALFSSHVGHLAETNELLRERSGARVINHACLYPHFPEELGVAAHEVQQPIVVEVIHWFLLRPWHTTGKRHILGKAMELHSGCCER
jgi:hypothetical protein